MCELGFIIVMYVYMYMYMCMCMYMCICMLSNDCTFDCIVITRKKEGRKEVGKKR